ncbi:MAG: PspC domain-containing protein [Candidatus Acidiferrales bacterium]
MNCSNCRREIAEASNFCYFCGVRQHTTPPAGTAPWAGKRLMRSSTDIKIAGVCAGFAEYLGWDVTMARLLWVLLTIMPVPFFPGVIGYIVCWLVMPVAPLPVPATAPSAAAQSTQTA